MKEFFLFSKCFCIDLFLSPIDKIIKKHKLKQGRRFKRLKFGDRCRHQSNEQLSKTTLHQLMIIGPYQVKKEKGDCDESKS